MIKNKIGAHVSFLKDTQLLGAVEQLIYIGGNSGAFYVSNSRSYKKTLKVNEDLTKQAKKLAKENNIDLKDIIVHSPLVGNIANIDKRSDTWKFSVKSYTEDIKTMDALGLKLFNFHPGSAADKELGIKKVAKAINKIHKDTKESKTVLLLETVTAKGNYIGSTFEELKKIIDLVDNKRRIGVCIDTCHVWDAGYDISKTNDFFKEFDKVIGLKYLKALHINDSKNELGSNKDRHEFIGDGHIGDKVIKKFINHPAVKELPKALETPARKENHLDKWKEEIKMLRKK